MMPSAYCIYDYYDRIGVADVTVDGAINVADNTEF
jgi:hypothetical protein